MGTGTAGAEQRTFQETQRHNLLIHGRLVQCVMSTFMCMYVQRGESARGSALLLHILQLFHNITSSPLVLFFHDTAKKNPASPTSVLVSVMTLTRRHDGCFHTRDSCEKEHLDGGKA